MRSFKRIIACFLAVVLLGTAFPFGALKLGAGAASDPYVSKYGVSLLQLFNLYPQYLSPEEEGTMLDPLVADSRRVLEGYAEGNEALAAYLATLDSGYFTGAAELLASLGVVESEKSALIASSAQLFLMNLFRNSVAINAAAVKTSLATTAMKDLYFMDTESGKAELITDLKNACTHLSDEEVQEICDTLFASETLAKAAEDYGIFPWRLMMGVVFLAEIEEEALVTLWNALPADSGLALGITDILNSNHEDTAAYVLSTFADADTLALISATSSEAV
ncbi:MAG: hypothetical protein IJC26_03995, partial [Clostridia bacterium]|nr:hypothetical protein [Clostridia bacterium]